MYLKAKEKEVRLSFWQEKALNDKFPKIVAEK